MLGEQPLSAKELQQVLTDLIEGRLSNEATRSLLVSMARRGETAEEIAAAVEVLRAHAVTLPLSGSYELCDTCGTGGDGKGTFNLSTLAALVAAACGVKVSKHGNRAASSRCGSADILEALGINLAATPEQVARCIEEVGFGFCFAPRFHPAMKAVAPIRKELGIRTLFNLVGPLANPAPLAFQLVGVSDSRLLRPMAEALLRLGVRHGMVVHGRDGLDEVTTTTQTEVLEVRKATLHPWVLDPESLGIRYSQPKDLQGQDAAYNAAMARRILQGETSPLSEAVALNAACAIYVANRCPTIAEAMEQARRSLRCGSALSVLDKVKAITHENVIGNHPT